MKDRGNRADVIVATKLGSPMGEGKQGLSRRYMMQAVEDSLQRLQTDYIDLYQAHRDDQETPLDEIMAAFERDLIMQTLEQNRFNLTRTADQLKISRHALRYRMQRLNISAGDEDEAVVPTKEVPSC